MRTCRIFELQPDDQFRRGNHAKNYLVIKIEGGVVFVKSVGYKSYDTTSAFSQEIVELLKTKTDVVEQKEKQKSNFRERRYERLR